MKTRQIEWIGKAVGAVVGFVSGILLFSLLSMLFNAGPNPIMFYISGFAFGALGSELGSKAVLKPGKKVKITDGVYVRAPSWKEKSRGSDGVTLTKDGARLVVAFEQGGSDATTTSILEQYATRAALALGEYGEFVDPGRSVVGVEKGERRSFTAGADGKTFEGEVTAFVISGQGLLFHGAAEAGMYPAVTEEVRTVIASLERE